MILHPAVAPSEPTAARGENSSNPWLVRWDALGAVSVNRPIPRWANRVLLFALALFALAVPHSIFAAHFSLNLSLLAWIVRDATMRKLHFRRTPLDTPLVCFAGLTVLSSLFSVEPAISLPKLKTLLLFGALYLLTTNLRPGAVRVLLGILLVSSLVGVGFSLFEKIYGRGMVITSLERESPLKVEPLLNTELQPGDVLWMIAKQRVYSLEQAASIIRRQPNGARLAVEALRAGDPIPVSLTVTEELKTRANPLGIAAAGRSRRFRVSGFTRQFLTYAEQMQLFALLSYGMLLVALAAKQRHQRFPKWLGFGLLFLLFSLALVLTASRAVIAAFLLALLLVSLVVGGIRAPLAAALLVLLLGGLSGYVILSARQAETVTFSDDSTARRLAYMRAGLRLIPRHPLLGVGMDAHKLHWQEWDFPGTYVTHTHSTPIQLALDRGLPALGCYFWWLAVLAGLAWRGHKRQRISNDAFMSGFLLGTFGAVIGFSVSSLANYNFGDSEVLLLLLLLSGLAVVIHQSQPAKPA